MPLVESLFHDLRQSFRALVRDPKFSLTALLILALCLGANIAIFSIVHGILVKPLPFREPEQLVSIYNRYPKAGVDRAGASVPHYIERKEGLSAVESAAAVRNRGVTIGETGSPERLDAMMVTPSFFSTVGASAALGRTFTEEEGNYGQHEVVLLSDGLWRQRFGGDPAVIGRTLRIDTVNHTIIGVMPPGFRFLNHQAAVWMPLCFSDDDRKPERRHANNMEMIARLKPGTTVASAQAELDALNQRALESDPYGTLVTGAGFTTVVRDLREDSVKQLRPALLLLQAGVFFLLLIGAVNLTNLLLVRATGRTKEYSIRQALGAGVGQISRALIVETVLLTLAGAVIGIALGAAAVRMIAVMTADMLPLAIDGVDPTVIAISLGFAVVLGLALATPVVWHTVRGNLTQALSVESRSGTTSRSVHRLRHGLVVAQITLAFVLLAGAGLLGLSFSRVLAVQPGFHADHVLTGAVELPWVNYKEPPERVAFMEKLQSELQAIPGVTFAGVTTSLPFSGRNDQNGISIDGRPLQPGESLQAHRTGGIFGDYLQTLGIPLIEGRLLTSEDSRAKNKVCVIDAAVAARYWPEGGAIGHRVINGPPDETAERYTIVGVVGVVKHDDLADDHANGAIYFPYADYASTSFLVAVRTQQAPEAAASAMRAAVLRVDPELALHDLKPMSSRVDDSLASRRLPLLLAGVFAGVALVLAAVGIYGVLAYAVAQRRREIGVRMALGALPEQILRQFLTLGVTLLAIALPLGLVGAWLSGQAMSGLLFGVSAANPWVLGGTALMLAIVALLACLLPARSAAKVAPIEALRSN